MFPPRTSPSSLPNEMTSDLKILRYLSIVKYSEISITIVTPASIVNTRIDCAAVSVQCSVIGSKTSCPTVLRT